MEHAQFNLAMKSKVHTMLNTEKCTTFHIIETKHGLFLFLDKLACKVDKNLTHNNY